jgi:dihydropteroate synthase
MISATFPPHVRGQSGLCAVVGQARRSTVLDLESCRMRPIFQWNLGQRSLELGKRTLIMGIVNVTPDSFSDGGRFLDCGQAVAHAQRLLDEGADILDIGGESTRPGARVDADAVGLAESEPSDDRKLSAANLKASGPAVSEAEELSRVLPVISQLKKTRPAAVLSVDTYKANVARSAVEAGAEIVNDVSGLRWDVLMRRPSLISNAGWW